jgi:hypothetical protein
MERAAPRRPEDEPDYLKELLARAGIDAQAHAVAAKLQELVIGELHPSRLVRTPRLPAAFAARIGAERRSAGKVTKRGGARFP